MKIDFETYLKAEKIVEKLREMETQHKLYQDVISGHIEEITLSTKNGEMKISDGEIANEITFLIDSYFFEKSEKIQEQLKSI